MKAGQAAGSAAGSGGDSAPDREKKQLPAPRPIRPRGLAQTWRGLRSRELRQRSAPCMMLARAPAAIGRRRGGPGEAFPGQSALAGPENHGAGQSPSSTD